MNKTHTHAPTEGGSHECRYINTYFVFGHLVNCYDFKEHADILVGTDVQDPLC